MNRSWSFIVKGSQADSHGDLSASDMKSVSDPESEFEVLKSSGSDYGPPPTSPKKTKRKKKLAEDEAANRAMDDIQFLPTLSRRFGDFVHGPSRKEGEKMLHAFSNKNKKENVKPGKGKTQKEEEDTTWVTVDADYLDGQSEGESKG